MATATKFQFEERPFPKMLTLFCVIVGQGRPFPVMVDASNTVDELKKKIKKVMPNTIRCDAGALQLYLALKDGAWLPAEGSIITLSYANADRMMKANKKLSELFSGGVYPAYCNDDKIHVVVVLPRVPRFAKERIVDPHLKQEITKLTEWSVGNVYNLPSLCEFMKDFGGCTQEGKLFWRLEEKQLVSIILKGWSGDEFPVPIENKKCILNGSFGVGKSTISCLLAFYAVFELKKNVILYRNLMKADQSRCLVYLGYENGQVKCFALPECTSTQAAEIYRELKAIQEVWLMLDEFVYEEIPGGLETFKLLATSHQVNLKSQELDHAYCILHSSWKLKDLICLGQQLKGWDEDTGYDRFYLWGGSVGKFLRANVEELRIEVSIIVGEIKNLLARLSYRYNRLCGDYNTLANRLDRLKRTFIKDPTIELHFITAYYWEEWIDSEYAILSLSVKFDRDYLYGLFNWAKSAENAFLAESVFEIYLHLLASDNKLMLCVSQYTLPEARKPVCPPYMDMNQLHLQHGKAIRSGTATNYETDLIKWRDDDDFVYWFPACYDFPNIDSIVKLKLEPGKKQVAYLQNNNRKEALF